MPDLSDLVAPSAAAFRRHEAVRASIRAACAAHPDVALFHDLGSSEAGRPLYGVVLGDGPRAVSLLAGAHADEPVGPETLRTLILEGLRRRDEYAALFAAYRFVVVPHVNPDGEARNRAWIEQWPRLEAYLRRAVREPPGRDLEFGFPAMRPENRCVAAFLRAFAPFHLHLSLHGMGFAEGAMLLVERHWAGRTQRLRDHFAEAARAAGLPLHDHNRKGEKGFFYIEPGFTTTPEGAAMRAYFRGLGDEATAAHFHESSMEFVRSLGGDTLCLVTELPLFVLAQPQPPAPGRPEAYLRFKETLPRLRAALERGEEITPLVEPFGLRALALPDAMRLQAQTIQFGLEALPEALPKDTSSSR